MKTLNKKEKKALKELVDRLKKVYKDNLVKVILYGSKARGDYREDSDIDILVVLKKYKRWDREFKRIFKIVNEICYKYDLLISYVVKLEDDFNKEMSPLLLNVRREGIVL